MKYLLFIFSIMFSLSFSVRCFASGIDNERAHFNYMMSCQGCHAPNGDSASNVPKMKGTVGYFLSTQNGREYLVRVPGSATSSLGDEDLAEVLNWIVQEFSGDSKPEQFTYFTAEEVANLRKDPLIELVDYRKQILAEINTLASKNNSE